MKNKKIWIAIALIAITFAAASFAQSSSAPKAVTIGIQLNTKAADPAKNFFNWTGDKAFNVKDKFDAAKKDEAHGTTGASAQGSTAKFDAIYKDNGKPDGNQTMSAGFRGLLLFPVSSYATLTDDAVQVSVAADKSITIRYVHRGVAYQIKSDKGGVINIESDCKKLTVCDNVAGAFVIKADYLKAGADNKKMVDVDWAKVEPKLEADIAASPTVKYGSNKIVVKYVEASGLLTITGGLTRK